MAYLMANGENLLITNFWMQTPDSLAIETASKKTPMFNVALPRGYGCRYYEALQTAINSNKVMIDWSAMKKKIDEKLKEEGLYVPL